MQGYVHEVNTGQSRGKKDILETLKELTTTQLVHNNDSKEFQKGVLLFEDVDNLFEEDDDKAFWSVLQHLLQVSRRPIIITCEDVTKVPRIFLDVLRQEWEEYGPQILSKLGPR